MLNGLLDLPAWSLILVTLAMTHITIACVTIFLHRCQAHRALELHPVVSHFFRFWLWLTTGMVTREWVAVHRKHHARCETDGDPHSPRLFGIRKVLLDGSELYRREAANPETLEKFSAGTPEDWIERHLYRRHPGWGVAVMFAADLALFGAFGITVWAVQMLWIPFWAAGVVNGLGHFWGYRNFETQDASTNLSPLGLLIGGEELHNNHHAYPNSARLSANWWELDIGWVYIRLLSILGLAKVRKTVPRIDIRRDKRWIDGETVQAVMRNRVHVLSLYARSVVLPVLRHEYRSAAQGKRRLLRQARPLLTREGIVPDEGRVQTLAEVLSLSHTLATVYRFREQLKEFWSQSSLSQEARLQSLREWCSRADLTGIPSLQDFAVMLRGYTLRSA